jgi:hypothetical protein
MEVRKLRQGAKGVAATLPKVTAASGSLDPNLEHVALNSEL